MTSLNCRLLQLLAFILAIHGVAIFFFTSGFLLTRTELPNVSTCADLSRAPCSLKNSTGDCWSPPGVKRAIVIIIDALRFDFVANTGEAREWRDRLPVLQRLSQDPNTDAQIFKYIADPPTTTLQRLKGLTTGGLPTFIDVGNSFGAPAIVEDNLIQQLKQNGKKVIAMGDDTWLQLFPDHFSEAYPFPSFNVKDLHTVDDGVIANLFPALQRDNWDVLIAHFLGVDHVGHIFGVESPLMVDKLEQYNMIIERIVSALRDESYPGGPHEDTMLIVMGDHGQTLNGDHGGGTAEEVETALFAMNMHRRKNTLPVDVFPYSCKDSHTCFSTLPQLDFAATMSMLLGVPIPYGSVGRVHPEFLSLGSPVHSNWLEYYRNVLCVNSWQVKAYLDNYGANALGGIPAADLHRLDAIYAQCPMDDAVKKQIPCYTTFLTEAASLARARWTQFGSTRMAFGLMLLVLSISAQALALKRASSRELTNIFPAKKIAFSGLLAASIAALLPLTAYILQRTPVANVLNSLVENIWFIILGGVAFSSVIAYLLPGLSHEQQSRNRTLTTSSRAWTSYLCDSRWVAAFLFVALHAVSLLSNSFIIAEGHVASFLLATIGLLYLRSALQSRAKLMQAVIFLVVNRLIAGIGLVNIVKDTHELRTEDSSTTTLGLNKAALDILSAYIPLIVLVWVVTRYFHKNSIRQKNINLAAMVIVPISCTAIMVHWLTLDLSDSTLLTIPELFAEFSRLQLPRLIYLSTVLCTGAIIFVTRTTTAATSGAHLRDVLVALLSCWGGSIVLLLGRKGPFIVLLALAEVWCITELQSLRSSRDRKLSSAAVDWNLLSVLLFFCTNHRCTFDGLRYPAAFIGFDEFNLYRQGLLLAIDTYGVSHILAVLGLPLLAISENTNRKAKLQASSSTLFVDILKGYLLLGFVRSITTAFSTICVALQRRHLMVWGLFAPKYVFDVVGLLLTDILIVLVTFFIKLCF